MNLELFSLLYRFALYAWIRDKEVSAVSFSSLGHMVMRRIGTSVLSRIRRIRQYCALWRVPSALPLTNGLEWGNGFRNPHCDCFQGLERTFPPRVAWMIGVEARREACWGRVVEASRAWGRSWMEACDRVLGRSREVLERRGLWKSWEGMRPYGVDRKLFSMFQHVNEDHLRRLVMKSSSIEKLVVQLLLMSCHFAEVYIDSGAYDSVIQFDDILAFSCGLLDWCSRLLRGSVRSLLSMIQSPFEVPNLIELWKRGYQIRNRLNLIFRRPLLSSRTNVFFSHDKRLWGQMARDIESLFITSSMPDATFPNSALGREVLQSATIDLEFAAAEPRYLDKIRSAFFDHLITVKSFAACGTSLSPLHQTTLELYAHFEWICLRVCLDKRILFSRVQLPPQCFHLPIEWLAFRPASMQYLCQIFLESSVDDSSSVHSSDTNEQRISTQCFCPSWRRVYRQRELVCRHSTETDFFPKFLQCDTTMVLHVWSAPVDASFSSTLTGTSSPVDTILTAIERDIENDCGIFDRERISSSRSFRDPMSWRQLESKITRRSVALLREHIPVWLSARSPPLSFSLDRSNTESSSPPLSRILDLLSSVSHHMARLRLSWGAPTAVAWNILSLSPRLIVLRRSLLVSESSLRILSPPCESPSPR